MVIFNQLNVIGRKPAFRTRSRNLFLDRMMKSREIPFDNGYGKELTPEMRDIFERGMDVRRESRIQTVSELREKLETVGIKKKKSFWKSRKFKLGVLVAVVGGIIVTNSFLNIMINIKISGRQEQSQKKNVLMKQDKALMVVSDDDEDYEYKVFHSEYYKEDILSITFLDNLDNMQEDAWDVSENKDGSVMAWVVPNEDKYERLMVTCHGGILRGVESIVRNLSDADYWDGGIVPKVVVSFV